MRRTALVDGTRDREDTMADIVKQMLALERERDEARRWSKLWKQAAKQNRDFYRHALDVGTRIQIERESLRQQREALAAACKTMRDEFRRLRAERDTLLSMLEKVCPPLSVPEERET